MATKNTTLLLAAAAGAGLFYLGMKQARASVPIRAVEGPLRPPKPDPTAPPPGPMAVRITNFIDGLDDQELLELRSVMPERWWSVIVGAAAMPTDDGVLMVFGPAQIDYSIMTPQQRDQLKDGIIDSVGYLGAITLQNILKDARVIP